MLEENNKRLENLKLSSQKEKERDEQIIRVMMENETRMQQQREAEFKKRLDKIQAKMAKMAETTVKNEKEKQLKEERRLLAMFNEKERRDKQEEERRMRQQLIQSQSVQN